MDLELFEQNLKSCGEDIHVEINRTQAKAFYKYMNLLIEWNEKVNLTAITEPIGIIVKHFIDSLTIKKYIDDKDIVIDIGTGAGFPGIPLKLLKERTSITLLDSLNKRITFLDFIIQELNLKEIETIHARAEELGRDKRHREQYDVAVSRAVAPLNGLLEYMSPFIKVGGKLICMKGPKLEGELAHSNNAIKLLGLEIERTEKIILPETGMDRNILILKKIRNVSKTYPRKGINIVKKPL